MFPVRPIAAAALLFGASAVACAASVPDVRIDESRSSVVGHVEVGLGPLVQKQRFRQGKRVTVQTATLYIDERSTIRKQQVEVGDDFIAGRERWIVVEIVPGGATSRGRVVVRKADD
ncbi:MAG: hypothetical protein HOW73_05365 [Polyangiaceae bacterium]|nr:hypothetical protein [Polyangiaceae bacterium]